jgi:hypothetical protein
MNMLYRLENDEEGWLSIKHVETDREVGFAYYRRVLRTDGRLVDACDWYSTTPTKVDTFYQITRVHPVACALMSAAYRQEWENYPDLAGAMPNGRADRIERRLGSLIADTALAFARAFCEASAQGLTAVTRDEFAGSLTELASIWWVSRFGAFDLIGRMGTEEPYFTNPLPSGPRLTFAGAAQTYGMRELRSRYPDFSDAERQRLLDWVLQWLSDVLSTEREEQQKDRERSRAWMLDNVRRCRSSQGPKASRRAKVPRCSS